MGRPTKYSADDILDAAASIVAAGGPGAATVGSITARTGAPSGSVYHRFATRELLLAQLWIRTVRRAQVGFVAALERPDAREAVRAAAQHVVAWSRENFADASVLILYRHKDLAAEWPEELGQELEHLNDGVTAAMKTFSRRLYGRAGRQDLDRLRLAIIDVPYAAVRRYLAEGTAIPKELDGQVADVATCFLQI